MFWLVLALGLQLGYSLGTNVYLAWGARQFVVPSGYLFTSLAYWLKSVLIAYFVLKCPYIDHRVVWPVVITYLLGDLGLTMLMFWSRLMKSEVDMMLQRMRQEANRPPA